MNGDRDIIHVSRSQILRSSPSAFRKSANGCSPSKRPVCATSLFSSSIPKVQSMYSGRRGTRSTISETLLLPLSSERKRLFGGKTPTKRTAVLTFPSLVANDGIADDQQDSLLEPNDAEDDMEIMKETSFSDESWHRNVPDSLRQPSCAEKVSKWLEESEQSAMTDLTDNRTVFIDDELDVSRREPCSTAMQVQEAQDCHNGNERADILPESFAAAESVCERPIDKLKRFRGMSLARLSMAYLKVIMCLSVVYLGFVLRIRPTSWDYYEPPPT